MYSFDVFETIVTRIVAAPIGVFTVMQKCLSEDSRYFGISSYVRENFLQLRVNSEKLARNRIQQNGVEDVTLREIYDYLKMTGCLNDDDINMLMELEISTEIKCCIGITENINRIKQLIANGEHVVLISDMYLPSEVIRKILLSIDTVFSDIPLYVSCEYRKIKSTTNLFQIVKALEKIKYSDWTHIGNSEKGDYNAPKKLGIDAQQYSYPQMLNIEKNLYNNCYDKVDVQLIIGASRNARIENTNSVPFGIGTAIGGPILVSYVEWILNESISQNINRLYFIARDGYILKEIADRIISSQNMAIETKYIYGSRKAWRMPSVDINTNIDELLNWSHFGSIDNYKDLSEIFQITESELLEFIPDNIKKVDHFSTVSKKAIRESLNTEPFKTFLTDKHSEKRKLLIKYLQQNIDTVDNRFAFVELAGSGYTQICLANLFSTFYDKPICSFFFKMDSMQTEKKCLFFTYFPSRLKQHILIEVLCHASHGQTIGYEENNNKVLPVIEKYEDEQLIKHGINQYINGVLAFLENRLQSDFMHCAINLDYLTRLFAYISDNPDMDLMDFVGDMPNSVTGREKKIKLYAPRLSNGELRKILLRNCDEPLEKYYSGTSFEYSVLRCTEKQKKMISDIQSGKSFFVFLNNIRRQIKGVNTQTSQPIDLDFLGEKVVLYAAGKAGQDCYKLLSKSRHHKVVLWVDKQWLDKQELGLKVSSPESIIQTSYDSVLIAIENCHIAEEIKNDLTKLGVPSQKIFTL